MITTLPAIQKYCSHVLRHCCMSAKNLRHVKRIANRRHRRALNQTTRSFITNPEWFDDEVFDAPSLSTWDLW